MKQVRLRVLIEGRLQGANFRLNTQQQADQLGLVGFIRTLSDGRTEIEAQGQEDLVDQLLQWCQAEPHSSQMKSILFRYDEPVNRYSEFSIR